MTSPLAKNALRPIALVEDDPDDTTLFHLLLRKSGVEHPTQIYARAEELMAAFTTLLKKSAAVLPLVCFLDLALPEMHGLDLLKWIRSHPKFDAISVVVLSADENPQQIKQASGFGAQCFLAKYPQPAVLRRVIAEATELAANKPAKHWFGITENLILRWGPSAGPAPA